jgi:hypothetical protein
MLRSILKTVARAVCGSPRVIFDREGKSPYLSRYYILGRPRMADGSSPINAHGNPHKDAIFPEGIGVFIHQFHRSDDDVALHNHPWQWAISLILAGGYREERRVTKSRKGLTRPGDVDFYHLEAHEVETFEYRPGAINVLTSETFHRVDLLEDDAWSLIFVGPKFSSWGFWTRDGGEFVPWRAFIARLRGDGWESRRG